VYVGRYYVAESGKIYSTKPANLGMGSGPGAYRHGSGYDFFARGRAPVDRRLRLGGEQRGEEAARDHDEEPAVLLTIIELLVSARLLP
jgi:hypothetical protein